MVVLTTLIVTAPSSSADIECKRRDKHGSCTDEDPGKKDGGDKKSPPPVPKPGDKWTEQGLTSVCGGGGEPGSPDTDLDCMAARSCPDKTMYKFRVWNRTHTYQGPGRWDVGDWRYINQECRDFKDKQVVTEEDVLREIRFKLRAAKLVLNPSNGRSLLNFKTIFYSTATTYPLHLDLGPGVDIEAKPAKFHWYFDDGDSDTSETAGRPYPHFDMWHAYTTTGTYYPRVDVEYEVTWTVTGGTPKTIAELIPGQKGDDVKVAIVESDPRLGGY